MTTPNTPANGGQIPKWHERMEAHYASGNVQALPTEHFKDLEIADLRAALAAPAIPTVDRNSILEEAAMICERLAKLYDDPRVGYDNGYTMGATRSAQEILIKSAAPSIAPQGWSEKLFNFIDSVVEVAFEGGDLDGGAIQEWAETAGLLEARTMTEPCSEGQNCRCADDNDFPLTCYQKTYSRLAVAQPTAQVAVWEGFLKSPEGKEAIASWRKRNATPATVKAAEGL